MNKNTILASAIIFSCLLPFSSTAVYAAKSATVKDAISDTAITAKIKARYTKSHTLKNQRIVVTTTNQNVKLSGEVKTNAQYERAIILAESVKGVKNVVAENLQVKSSNAPLSDAYITAKVKSKFLKEKMFGTRSVKVWPVKVETKDSVVYLTGSVDTEAEQKNLVQLARQVKGVKYVKTAVTLN